MTTTNKNIWIQTHNGIKFNPLNPNKDDIIIDDISLALSNICRFAGHCKSFYSVAQHSLTVAELLPAELQLIGLLHDGSEAYIHDISRPLKSVLSEYQKIEQKLQYLIYDKFNILELYMKNIDIIKIMDNRVLVTEQRDLMKINLKWPSLETYQPFGHFKIIPMSPEVAYKNFNDKFNDIIYRMK